VEEDMMLKKITLGTLLLTCPWLVFGHDARQGQQQQQGPAVVDVDDGMSVDDVRAKCEEVRGDAQKQPFAVIAQCRNQITEWRAGMGYYSSPRSKYMTVHTSTKDDRFHTAPSSSSGVLASKAGTCPMYYQFERTMELSVTLTVDQCSQINHDYLSEACREATNEYCADNSSNGNGGSHPQQQQQQQQQQQASDTGMCVWNQIAVVDGCAGYSR
jgi:hypothetical protein